MMCLRIQRCRNHTGIKLLTSRLRASAFGVACALLLFFGAKKWHETNIQVLTANPTENRSEIAAVDFKSAITVSLITNKAKSHSPLREW